MIRQPVNSSNLDSVGYDPEQNILQIKFKSGGIYNYHDVAESVYLDLLSAPSKGKFFHEEIKGNYKYVKVI